MPQKKQMIQEIPKIGNSKTPADFATESKVKSRIPWPKVKNTRGQKKGFAKVFE